MGYRRVKAELLWAIHSRRRGGESNRTIAAALGLDKKTVNQYVAKIGSLYPGENLTYPELLELLTRSVLRNEKPKPAIALLEPHAEEIRTLIGGDKSAKREPMKAKTAWEVVSRRYELRERVSYETFKRFVRERVIVTQGYGQVIRLETESGKEVQIDYGRVGMKLCGARRRVVKAFCGILSCSRLPYIRFVLSEDEVAFAQATASMFTFYGGVSERINLDNLKAGILSADLYDPTVNRTFAELCDHYDVIADPARVASPKDKGKVERFVQVARELFKRLDALYPDASLDELNEHARAWCLEEYGRKKHGTTGLAPHAVFEEVEKPCLKPLPAEPFVPARWTIAKVHPDQFVQANGKYYGLPAAYIGRRVDLRITDSLVTIYYENRAVRQYPASNKRRIYLADDFPAHAQPFVPGSYAAFLIGKAERFGPQSAAFLCAMIEEGGNLSLRRAQGCLALIERHAGDRGFSHVLGTAIAERVYSPDRLRVLFDADAAQNVIAFPVSETGKAMTRGADYYVGP